MPKKAVASIPPVMTGWEQIEDYTSRGEDFLRREMRAGRIHIPLIGRRRVLTREEYLAWLGNRSSDDAPK